MANEKGNAAVIAFAEYMQEKSSWSGKDETRAEALMRACGELDIDALGTLFPKLGAIKKAIDELSASGRVAISETDRAAIAKAVNDELAKRQQA